MTGVELVVADDPIEATAQHIAAAVRAGGHIGLSGGGTPGPAYTRAAQLEPDWSSTEVWWIDDRCVPPDHEDSNFLLVQKHLLSQLRVQPRAAHRVQGELAPEDAAARYDAELTGVALDLAIMGIGPDGHTASLFPDAPELDEPERRAVAAEARWEPFVPRVTMTIPALAESRLMVYLVTGADKAGPVERAFRQAPSPHTPASLVRGAHTVAILDAAASAA